MGDEVTLQVFEGTEGIPTNAEVVFLGQVAYTESERPVGLDVSSTLLVIRLMGDRKLRDRKCLSAVRL